MPNEDPTARKTADAEMEALTRQHYENFSVLSGLVPRELRLDFSRVYWFCRTADDLADEHDGSAAARQRALERLREFRNGLDDALNANVVAGGVKSPAIRAEEAFGSLALTIRKRNLSVGNFHLLLDAFEQDQRVTRYHSLEELLDYCTKSANPVGRIVLELGGLNIAAEDSREIVSKSDAICTALQLVNHCQDVRRDALERDRIYVPLSDAGDAEAMSEGEVQRLAQASRLDAAGASRVERWIAPVLTHAQRLFSEGGDLPEILRRHPQAGVRSIAPVVHLMLGGGLHIQSMCEESTGLLLWKRPKVSKWAKLRLLAHSVWWRTFTSASRRQAATRRWN